MLRARVAALVCLALGSVACPTENSDNAACRTAIECGAGEAPCTGCPTPSDALCLAGVCEARAEDAVEVRGDVRLDRDIAPGVRSFVHVLAAETSGEGPFSCASAFDASGRVADAVNVLAAGYKAVSGGPFHTDVSFGRAPDAPVAVLIVATAENAGAGAVLGTGCVEPKAPAGAPLSVGVIDVGP